MNNEDGKRLKDWRKKSKLSQKNLGEILGRSQGYIGDVESGRTQISRDLLDRLTERTTVSREFLLTGIGPMDVEDTAIFGRRDDQITAPDRSRPAHGDFAANGHDFVFIRRFNISVSAGPGLVPVAGDDIDHMAFSASWLTRYGLNSDLCGLVKVRGDSMAPTIPDGSLVLVHAGENQLDQEGIYAFSRGNEAYIKRLTPINLSDNGKPRAILIISDNPAFPPETFKGERGDDIRVAGRVRAVITAL